MPGRIDDYGDDLPSLKSSYRAASEHGPWGENLRKWANHPIMSYINFEEVFWLDRGFQ
jgi:hypothetical protein